MVSIKRQQNARLRSITGHAKLNLPINYCFIRRVIFDPSTNKIKILVFNSASFSSGSRIIMLMVQNTISWNIVPLLTESSIVAKNHGILNCCWTNQCKVAGKDSKSAKLMAAPIRRHLSKLYWLSNLNALRSITSGHWLNNSKKMQIIVIDDRPIGENART